jgi:acyl-CoA reductase-like NAD-dependent aldehyde dehydrogenase
MRPGRHFPEWRGRSPEQRANLLLAAAEVARKRIHELAAWQILEVGKQWDQAQADVAEAIDFLEYYAREIVRLGTPRRMGRAPGEMNLAFYQPKGIAAVIAPWNFPLAISCGMASAALAAATASSSSRPDPPRSSAPDWPRSSVMPGCPTGCSTSFPAGAGSWATSWSNTRTWP